MPPDSPSLVLDCDWIDEPAAKDAIERRTWADLRIHVGGRVLTRVYDRATHSERSSIFVPTFPIVQWIVANWWPLLFEPCPDKDPPSANGSWKAKQSDWLNRHCLRSADSGLLLPRAFIYSDGRNSCVSWRGDSSGEYPHMPAEFMGGEVVTLPVSRVEDGLRAFVRQTIDRLQHLKDASVESLRENWAAISNIDPEEAKFCRATGRLGLDPYSNELSRTIEEFLEGEMSGYLDQPLGIDFLESAPDQASAAKSWRSIEATVSQQHLGAAPKLSHPLELSGSSPAKEGYARARRLRQELSSESVVGPLRDLNKAAHAADVKPAKIVNTNEPWQTVVGWHRSQPVIAGASKHREDSNRFVLARSLYLLLYSCQESPRLCTSAHTWDQKASRAFAAELLAPQAEVAGRWHETLPNPEQTESVIEDIAHQYLVSTHVVEHQLDNAGIDYRSF